MERARLSLLAKNQRIARAVQFVLGDLSVRRPLDQVAKAAGLERTYFSFYFHRVVGLTFTEWDSRARIEAAKRLLAESGAQISLVAMSVGYSDPTTFGRNFRKHMSCTPREYRRKRVEAVARSIQTDAENLQIFDETFKTGAET